MAYQRTLAQLRTSIQVRGNYENSDDITPAVLLEVINDALEETYNILIACQDDWRVKIGTPVISIVAGTDTYALPTDFYELRKVEIAKDAAQTQWQALRPVPLDGANRVSQFGLTKKRYRYRLSSLGLTLYPPPASADVMRIYYLPLAPQLAVDGDTVTFDRPIEQKLVLYLALRDCLMRQDLSTLEMDGAIERLSKTLRTVAESHDDGEPFYLSRNGPSDSEVDEDGFY